MKNFFIFLIIVVSVSCSFRYCSSNENIHFTEIKIAPIKYDFNKNLVQTLLTEFTKSPHVFGSQRQYEISQYIKNVITPYVDKAVIQQFQTQTPNLNIQQTARIPYNLTISKKGYNVFGILKLNPKSSCAILIGSHYDTKYIPGINYLGANDSGSSSALLIDLLRFLFLNKNILQKAQCNIIAAWFDGEESVLEDWNDGLYKHPAQIQDNTYGSRYLVDTIKKCNINGKEKKCLPDELEGYYIEYVIIVDMIGSPNLRLSHDLNSDKDLLQLLKQVLNKMQKSYLLNPNPTYIEDDHIPFIKAGIKALDIIDFNNLQFWHNENDKIENISYESIELTGNIVWNILYNLLKF